jgi:hypothetical protein
VAMGYDLQQWNQATTQSRFQKTIDQDILRWGYTPHGSFTLKEGYTLHEKFQNLQKDGISTTIWKSKISPKISTFLSLLLQKKILTWDNLQRFGFIGPSICYLCHLEVETMEHLLNNSPFSENIWKRATLFMRRTK